MTDKTEITVTQASERLGKTRKTIHNMIADGRLSARLISDAPKPYFLVSVASITIYEAQVNAKRDQSEN